MILSLLRWWTLPLLLGACMSAYGQTQLAQQDLYLDALRSISEGRQVDASESLIRMIENEPQHAGAWLDLAIIQCELGRAEEAERLFKTIESKFSPPPIILEVIASQRARGCKGWQGKSHMSLMLGRGIDSNVNQGASNPNFTIGTGELRVELQLLPEHLPQKDSYTLLSAEYMRDLTPNGTLGFMQLRALRNDSLTRYDTSSLVAGVEHPWRWGSWGMRGTGLVALHGLGGKLYQVQSQAQVRMTPPLRLPRDLQFSTIAGVSHVEYPTLESFDANTWELRGLLTYRTDRTQAHTSLGYLYDSASGARPGGDRAGWFAGISARTRIAENVYGETSWTRQNWLSRSAYSPGLIDEVRNQKTQVLRGALIFPIADRQAIHVEVRGVRNNENISVFQYNSRQLQVSWQWQDF
ncbi:MAG TPA: tetratricopeptide repeat protein [Noviherbaspirillum sp.]|nr:tetratricopeptide repeat protein [Noviherbaspirillum sp.]